MQISKRLFLYLSSNESEARITRHLLCENAGILAAHGYHACCSDNGEPLAEPRPRRPRQGEIETRRGALHEHDTRPLDPSDRCRDLGDRIRGSDATHFIASADLIGLTWSADLSCIDRCIAGLGEIDVRLTASMPAVHERLELSYQGRLRDGFGGTIADCLAALDTEALHELLDHAAVIDRWSSVLGASRVRAIAPDDRPSRERLIDDLANLLRIPATWLAIPDVQGPEPRLSAASCEVLRRVNRLDPSERTRQEAIERLRALDEAQGESSRIDLIPRGWRPPGWHAPWTQASLGRGSLSTQGGETEAPTRMATDLVQPSPPSPRAIADRLMALRDLLPRLWPEDSTPDLFTAPPFGQRVLGDPPSSALGRAPDQPATHWIDRAATAGASIEPPRPREIPIGTFEKAVAALMTRRDLDHPVMASMLPQTLARLTGDSVKVLSLDVFDTALLRDDTCEARRYWKLAARLAQLFSAGDPGRSTLDFFMTRYLGMELSYRARPDRHGCREGLIDEVLRTQAELLRLDDSDVDALLKEELSFEIESLTPNRPLLAFADDFVRAGGRLVFLSDMYLSARHIKTLFDQLHPTAYALEQFFSSADLSVSKGCGRLFTHVAAQLGVSPRQLLHVGDSKLGDFQNPRRHGWRSLHFPCSDHEIERRTLDLADLLSEVGSLGIDASRWAKL